MLLPFLYVMICSVVVYIHDHLAHLTQDFDEREFQRQTNISMDIILGSTLIITLITLYFDS